MNTRLLPALVCVALVTCATAHAQSLTVSGTTVLPEDTIASYSTITVQNGGVLEIGGGSNITVTGTLAIQDGGTVLARGKNVTTQVGGAWVGEGVTIQAVNVTVATGGLLSADGQGYRNGAGPGAHAPISGQPNYHIGASHGGRGVTPFADRPALGAPLAPVLPGSSGGIYITETTAGGGAIRLIVSGTLALDGEISADGTATDPAAGVYHGGAAGGSIWVTAGTLTGAGRFTADASARSNSIAASAGGRIAVHVANAAGYTGFASATALGTPDTTAEAGTIAFVDTSVGGGHLRVFQRLDFVEDSAFVFGAVTVESGGLLRLGGGSTFTVSGTLAVAGGGTLLAQGKHMSGQVDGAWAGVGVTIEAAHVSVAAGGVLSADGQGYRNGAGPGAHAPISGQPNYHIGASHGGRGVTPFADVPAYGSDLAPTTPGSSGGIYITETTAGGGAIRLIVSGTLALDGEISADGTATDPATGVYHGGAAGGSIWVTTGTLTGAGRFTADASARSNSIAACAGGRIAVYYVQASGFSGFAASSANPTPDSAAEPGTVGFIDTTVEDRHLRVFQRWRVEPGASATWGRLTLDDAAVFELGGGGVLHVLDTLVVRGDSQLRVEGRNTTARVAGVWAGEGGTVRALHVSVEDGSAITADGQGYRNPAAPELQLGAGPGFDLGALAASQAYDVGSSHGGAGRSITGYPIGPVYGNSLQPRDLGSCGGRWNGNSSAAGGGAIHLIVEGALTLDGEITADGQATPEAVGINHGGASGGSLWVEVHRVQGTGRFTADAAPAANTLARSAGGRIAVYYREGADFGGFATSSVDAGGAGAQDGTLLFLDRTVPGHAVRVTRRMAVAEGATAIFGSLTIDDGALFELGGGAVLDIADSLVLSGDSTLRVHTRDLTAQPGGAWIGTGGTIAARHLTVAAGSRITADGAGYRNGAGPGYSDVGMNPALRYQTGSSHGGRGAPATGFSIPASYGSALEPVSVGSSGGIWTTETTAGGGAIRILVEDTLTLGGEISARGAGTTPSGGIYHGGASGGSIWVTTHTLTGAGRFVADAAPASNSQGQSAGGRIAVHSADATGFAGFAASTAARGGPTAEHGTVAFVDTSGGRVDVRVFGRLATEEGDALVLDSLTLEPGATFDLRGASQLVVEDVFDLKSGSTVHLQSVGRTAPISVSSSGPVWAGAGAAIDAGTMRIADGARLDGDGQGYLNGAGPGGVTTVNDYNTGASHGGRGGGTAAPAVYGSARAPRDLGSGGGRWSANETTAGGGAVFLNVADELMLDGTISVDGAASGPYHAGATGGSIMINAGAVSGAGSITADAAASNNSTAGSGGGRIAVHTAGENTLGAGQYSVRGSAPNGADGTVHVGTTPQIEWLAPEDPIVRGSVSVRWSGLALNRRTTTYDLLASGEGHAVVVATDLREPIAATWDASAVPDGRYELSVIARGPDGAALTQGSHFVTVINDAEWHTGTITASETWAAGRIHLVSGVVTIVAPATVTIEPGAVVKFLPGASLVVDTGATLAAPGGTARTILTDFADDTAGGDTNRDGDASRPVTGRWGGVVGLPGATLQIDDTTEIRYVVRTYSGTLATSQTWMGNQVHVVAGELTVPAGVTLTIQPGAIVKFTSMAGISVNGDGTLSALGTLAQPIIFTSHRDDAFGGDTNGDGNTTAPAPGDWRWLYIGGEAHLRHAHVLYAGGSPSGVWNGSAAIRTTGVASVTLENTFIKDAFFDGVLPWGGTMTITNCVITRADRGIMAHPGSTVTVTNTTVDQCREGINCHGGTLTVANSLVTNCLISGIQYDFGVLGAITHTSVWNTAPTALNYRNTPDLTGTAGNISRDPRYRDAARDDYRLGYLSPAIDAADGALAPETDMLGAPRYDDPRTPDTGINGVADMGAYEFADTAPSQLDLSPSLVDGPAEARVGTRAEVRWTITNVGPVAIQGPWRDRVALQPAADLDAPLVHAGEFAVGTGLRLGPGESAVFSREVTVPPAIDGRYRWVVETNIHADIFEGQNTANNRHRAATSTLLTVPALSVGGEVAGTFTAAGVPALFKVTPQAGTDVLLSLDRAAAGGWTRLALAADRLPTLSDHDALSPQWNTPDASAALAPATGATVYVAAYPLQLPSTPLGFTLRAQEVAFALERVDLARGANRGTATIPIVGTGLRAGATVTLTRGGATLTAASLYLADGTRLHATFDLTGAVTGAYDLHIEQGGVVRTLAGAFTIVAGRAGELRTAVLMPPIVRAGRQFTAWIEYENVGETDLVLPIIGVTSPDGTPLALVVGDTGAPTLSVLATSPVGTPWILAPGQSGRVPVLYTTRDGQNRIVTTVTTVDSTATMNWAAVRAELRPAVNVPTGWDAAWDATVAFYGATTGDYARWMRDAFALWHTRTGLVSHDPAPALRFALAERIASAAARVEGRVYLGDTSRPLGGIVVSLLDAAGEVGAAAMTARDGFVRFTEVPAGAWLAAFDDHLPPAGHGTFALPASGPVLTRTWVLQPGGEIRGTVLLDGSLDRTTLAVAATDLGGRHSAAAEIDSLGRYRLSGLPTGTYTVALVGDGIVPVVHSGIAVTAGAITTGPLLPVTLPGRISGVVTRADNAAPLAGATVVASADGRSPATSVADGTGAFTLTGLSAGTYTVAASANGRLPASVSGVVLVPGGHTTGVDLTLTAGATLLGTVTSGGQPVSGALVAVVDGETVLGTATTVADGTYFLQGLPGGTWELGIDHSGFDSFFEGVVIAAGGVAMRDVVLTPAAKLEGSVRVSAGGAGIAGVMVRLVAPDGSVSILFSDSDGRLALGRLADGTYALSLQDGSQRRTFSVSGGVVSGSAEFTLATGALRGRVLAADGEVGVPAVVQLVSQGRVVISQRTNAAGEYGFDQLAPGTFGLRFASFDAFFPELDGVVVSADATTRAADVRAGNAVLEVTVHDGGSPVTGDGAVFLTGSMSSMRGYELRLLPLENGRARFTDLAPGAYRVRAVAAGRASAVTSIAVAGGEGAATIDLLDVGTLRGQVRDGQGLPLAAVEVLVHPAGNPGALITTATGPDGAYAIETLPAGTYEVWFAQRTTETGATLRAPVRRTSVAITAGDETEQNATLQTTAAGLSGQIADSGGSFPLNAVVELRTAGGLLVASSGVGTDGAYALPHVPDGSYEITARGMFFRITPREVVVSGGAAQTDLALEATWVGGFGILAGAEALSRPGTIVLASFGWLEFDGFNNAWAQQVYNALAEWVKKKLGEPPFKVPGLTRPPGLFDDDCPCPEAVAAWQRSLHYQKYADLQWDQWHEYWEGRQHELWSQIGVFGANLLKFAGSLAGAAASSPKIIGELQESRRGALNWLNSLGNVNQTPAHRAAWDVYHQAGAAISRIESLVANLGTPANLVGSVISDGSGNLSGTAGNFQAVIGLMKNPLGSFSTDQGITAFVESVSSCVNNVAGVIGAVNLVIESSGRVGFGPLATLADKLGPITEGLQTLIEAGRAANTALGMPKALADYEAIYHHRIKMRDEAYRICLQLLQACRSRDDCNEDDDDPEKEKDKPKPPAPDGGSPGGSGGSSTITSVDPNDKASTGVGENGYITPGSPIYYHIRFENLPTATAAAQLVTIADQLSPSLDWSTFELVSIGFNGTTLTPPPGLQSYSARTFVESDPNPIDVNFSLNPETGLAFWSMRSVDAMSGDWPEDPFAGFLPPNDESGRGEGHVGFLIRPRADLEDGASFTNQARIIFDDNEPIDTNVVINTIDASPATAATATLAATSHAQFALSWSGYDAGSGVARYEVWVSVDGGVFTLWRDGITGTSTVFTGEVGRTYAFYVRAFDRLGQAVGLAPVAQTTTTIVPASGSSRLVNISTRGFNGAGNEAMIVGFVVRPGATGSAAKNLLLRGVGPALVPFGVQDALADPSLQLFDRDGLALGSNDNWGLAPNAGVLPAEFDRLGAFGLPAGSADAVVLDAYPPGIYTARVSGAGDSTGVTLVEAYDADTSFDDPALPQILNLSTRGWVGTDDATLIAGFVIAGDTPKALLIRAVGPTLGGAPFNLPGTLADPVIRLADGAGATVYENDDWGVLSDSILISEVSDRVGAFGLPAGSKDAVMVVVLPPGRYTALVSGRPAAGSTTGSTGLVILELYDADL